MTGNHLALQLLSIWLFGIQWNCGVSLADDSLAAQSAPNSSLLMSSSTPSPSVDPAVLLWSVIHPVQYYRFDPNTVDFATRNQWCSIQTASCGNLCQDSVSLASGQDTCDPLILDYVCTCADGSMPNPENYTQTIPYLVCTYSMNDFMQACDPADVNCAQGCTRDKMCSAPHPKLYPQVSSSVNQPAETGKNLPAISAFPGVASLQTSASGKNQNAILQISMLAVAAFICLII